MKFNDADYKKADEANEVPDADFAKGWHFCCEWDYMLIGPGMPETSICLCEADIKFTFNKKREA